MSWGGELWQRLLAGQTEAEQPRIVDLGLEGKRHVKWKQGWG